MRKNTNNNDKNNSSTLSDQLATTDTSEQCETDTTFHANNIDTRLIQHQKVITVANEFNLDPETAACYLSNVIDNILAPETKE